MEIECGFRRKDRKTCLTLASDRFPYIAPIGARILSITNPKSHISYHKFSFIKLPLHVLRGGGDTKFLMVADILFLWVASIPLGYLAGLVFHWPSFWIYVMLKIDQIIKCFWCTFRLKSGKWMKKIKGSSELAAG